MSARARKTSSDFIRPFETPKPKRKDRGCAVPFLITLILCTTMVIYVLLQFSNYQNFAKGKPANSGELVNFEVRENENLDSITSRLVEAGILPGTKVFTFPTYKVYLRLHDIDVSQIQPGIHKFPRNASADEIFNNLRCRLVRVTLIEGHRIEEFAQTLENQFGANSNFNKNEFINTAQNLNTYFTNPQNELQISFNHPNNLEGFLFPDTYEFCHDVETKFVIQALVQNFDQKVFKKISGEIISKGMTIEEVINYASMIEREGRTPETKKMIADILIRRIKQGIPLGVDATSQYGGGYSQTQSTWWPSGIELDRLVNEPNPYNTRFNQGLPPTPISNPGLISIQAVLNPTPNQYLFYLTGNDNQMYYATTSAEHDLNYCRHITETCN